jgi:hypothetical protein
VRKAPLLGNIEGSPIGGDIIILLTEVCKGIKKIAVDLEIVGRVRVTSGRFLWRFRGWSLAGQIPRQHVR